MTREPNIVHEAGDYWVCHADGQYTVYRIGLTHSTADSSYPNTPDGRSIAIARCDYLARTRPNPNHFTPRKRD